ncbi:MAG: ribosomal RNA small subunit methyltransferase A [Leptospiraceae bacterium]|nr:ribosomal RNA small subunit methyltransferase A [Leptospiraceae bacterium]
MFLPQNFNFEFYKPSKINEFLRSNQVSPQKKWGQNFLIDPNIVELIFSSFPKNDYEIECIGEIGTGLGVLSHRIASSDYPVFFFEIDPFLCKFLQSNAYFQKNKHTLLQGDVLKNLNQVANKKIFIFGNLPYYITSDIFTTLLKTIPEFQGGVFMVQKEFAKRLIEEISSISIFISAFCEIKWIKKISKTCFYPSPKEESALITLKSFPNRIFTTKLEVEKFELVLKTFFWGKRKTLYKSAKEAPFYSSIKERDTLCEALVEIKVPEKTRPEQLTKNQFYEIAKIFIKKGA